MIRKLYAFVLSTVLLVSVMSSTQVSAGTLSNQPLSLKGAVPPTVMFALSVEFPTAITAAYQNATGYSNTSQYLGYFDNEKCYSYDVGNGWFFPTSVSAARTCTLGWSGNFLNWASMTGLDEYRYAMTGGNRYRDTATLTVLERSYQSNQGSASSNFPDKTYTDVTGTATPFPAGTTLTIKNWNQGVNMTIAQGASNSDSILCESPSASGAFSCALSRLATAEIGACSTWVGAGSSASPYACGTFGAFNGLTPSSFTNGTKASASSAATSTNVTCTPGFDASNNFTCSPLQLTNTHTGTCAVWDPSGDGSVAHPYRCLSFGTFSGGENVAQSASGTVSAQSLTYFGAQTNTTYTGCSVTNGSPVTTSCNASSAPTITCNTYSGNGGTSPYTCTSFGLSGGAQFVSATVNGSSTTSISSKKYYTSYVVSYKPKVTGNVSYVSNYPVAQSNIYYYYANYGATFGTAPTTFAVRVKVCDSSVGLESNCQQFGTSYKPTGVVQDNGSTMRFGVTSYFNANDIDNAVLRSKAKFVAPTQFAGSGTSTVNPYMEWSAADGTLFTNPANCADGTTVGAPVNCTADTATTNSYVGATSNSGVINYINKFGRASQGYKTYDDTGKLYYETLKYLRGMSATPDFYNGAKASNADGFPVISNWDNPLTTGWSCQKNYIVAMGDTHTWCDKRLPGGAYGASGNSVCNAYTDGNAHGHVADYGSLSGDSLINVASSTSLVGGWEGLAGLSTSLTGAGGASFEMAGLASWAASHDIVTGSATASSKRTVRSYVIDVEEAKDCGYQSQYWLTSKYGVPEAYDNVGNWIGTNADWKTTQAIGAGQCTSRLPPGYTTAGGGVVEWPKQLLRANDPAGMIGSVRSAIAQIAALTGDEAALAQSSGTLDTGTGAYTYRAAYNSGGWKGDVSALAIDTSGNFGATEDWSASRMLPAPTNRNIISWNPVTHTAFLFVNAGGGLPSGMSAVESGFLNSDDAGNFDGLGGDRVNYLRGDQSKEIYAPGTTTLNLNPNHGWRARTSMVTGGGILGDFINSNPLFLGPPNTGYSFAGYKAFATLYANRTPILFVGGNDGMLHAFDASYNINTSTGMPVVTANSGKEVMGYIPSVVYNNLSKLMSPNYSHKYFVDGSPVGGDICADSCTGAADWKTIVVGTTGAGGQGVFAIDATNGSFSTSSVMWEFTDADDSDLGYTLSKPVIRKLNDGKWYVIFGNGYNNTDSDSHSSSTGRAVLYLLRANGPANASGWTLNTDYFKIELVSPTEPTLLATRLANPNGLSSVSAIDINGDDVSDYVYAGDRNGNLWKVDVTSTSPLLWASSFALSGKPVPLFSAIDASGNKQQITTGVEVVAHPTSGVLVTFGTGSWIDNQDAIGPFPTQESFYGIWDKMDGTRATRSDLQKQAVVVHIHLDSSGNTTGLCNAGDADCYAVLSNCTVNYTTDLAASNLNDPLCPANLAHANNQGQQLGWVTDMPASGERTRSSMPRINGSNVKFQTLTPTTDPCTGNTIGMEYQLSAFTGGMPSLPVYVTGSSNSGVNTLNSSYFPSLGGSSVAVVASGRTVAGGASDNPVQFNARPPSSVVTPPQGMPAPPNGPCIGVNCSGYIPGWGFLMNLNGATAANSRFIYSCHPPQFGNGAPVCNWEYKRGQFGRLNWKQINR